MKDPVRMIDAGDDATAFERDLLRAGRGAKLSPGDRARIWTGVSAQLVLPVSPPSPGAGSTSTRVGTTVAHAAATASLVKGAVVAIVLAGAATAGYRATRPAAPVAVAREAAPAGAIPPAPSNESVGVAPPVVVIDPPRAPARAVHEGNDEVVDKAVNEAVQPVHFSDEAHPGEARSDAAPTPSEPPRRGRAARARGARRAARGARRGRPRAPRGRARRVRRWRARARARGAHDRGGSSARDRAM